MDKTLDERIAKALIMRMVSDCPALAPLPPQFYPIKAEYNANPDEMAQLIRDMQERIKELSAEQLIYQIDKNGDISIAKCKNCKRLEENARLRETEV